MINKVIIKRLDGQTNDTFLSGCYTIAGKLRILKDTGDYDDYPIDGKENPMVKDIVFGEKLTQLVFEYETDEDKQSAQDKRIERVVKVFYGQHPLIKNNGKGHKNLSPAAMFDMVDHRDESILNIKRFNDILATANKIVSMTTQERRDVAYYYGESPAKKTDGELILALADFKTGICTNENIVDSFLKTWGTTSNEDRDMTVILRKAVEYNVINHNIQEGRSNYYLGTQLIGTSENDLISYSKSNKEIYEEFIKRSVKEKDNFKAEDKENEKEKKLVAGEKLKSFSESEISDLRIEAKELKQAGFIEKGFNYGVVKVDKLKAEVDKARILKEQSRKNELQNA